MLSGASASHTNSITCRQLPAAQSSGRRWSWHSEGSRAQGVSKLMDLLSCCESAASIGCHCPREVRTRASTKPTCCEAIPQHRAATSPRERPPVRAQGMHVESVHVSSPHRQATGAVAHETHRQRPNSDLQHNFFSKISIFFLLLIISTGHQVILALSAVQPHGTPLHSPNLNVNFLNYMGIKAVT